MNRARHFGGRIFFLALFVMLGARSGADNIFDDNWTPPPPKRPAPDAPATPADANHSATPGVKLETTKAPSDKPSPVSPTLVIVAPARRAVPSKADQDRSRAILKEVFAKQLADRSAAGRYKLGQDLLEAERKIKDNPVDRFVLLSAAVQAGREAGSVPLCFEAADGMAEAYEVDDLAVRTDAMLKMSFAGAAASDAAKNVGPGIELLDQLVASGDFTAGTQLCAVLQKASASSAAEREIVQKRVKAFGALRAAHDEFLVHKAKLEQWPDDAAANFAVGSYYCFVENRWNIGMSLLSKGSNAAVKGAVATEQSRPQTADQLVTLGDAWWDAGEKENAASIYGSGMRRHAAGIYEAALDRGGITGLSRTRLEKRIEVATASASGPGPTKPRRVLLWRRPGREDAEEAVFKRVANGDVVTPGRATAMDVMGDPTTYSKYSIIVFGPSLWRELPAQAFSNTVRRSVRDFVRNGGDLILFEQLNGGKMSIVTDLFGVKTVVERHGAVVEDPELKEKAQAAGIDDRMLKSVHFLNVYEDLPEGSRILLRCVDANGTAGAVIVPFEKGRVILIGTSWDKLESKLNTAIVELAYRARTSKR